MLADTDEAQAIRRLIGAKRALARAAMGEDEPAPGPLKVALGRLRTDALAEQLAAVDDQAAELDADSYAPEVVAGRARLKVRRAALAQKADNLARFLARAVV